ncbi:TraB/GumN family protein [Rhizobium helianthi]|uniref:TraB/GumN family protein n=1 Tax=Rhizobium helianthi TaxID=1132695 RepID=A0ABW4M655_9HYPH
MTLRLNEPSLFRRVGNDVLSLMAALHTAAFLTFLLVLALAGLGWSGKVQAAEQACTGQNLLAEWKLKDPAAYRKVEEEAAKIANGKGLFWQIEKPGIAKSYLLGTMHVTDPAVLKMPPGAPYALSKARLVIVESDEILDEKKAMAGMLAKPELNMIPNGKTIEQYLTPESKVKLEAALKQRGIPLAAVSRMQPWLLASFLALPACELTRKAQGATFLDKKIALEAVAKGVQVKGLETMEEQLSAMASIPVEFHIKSLIEMIDLGPRLDDVTTTMRDLYISGEIGMTMPMLKAVAPDGTEGEGYAEFEERIVRQRNHVMAERAAPLLDKGGAFMAVGALHLVGDEGLVALLQAKGFTVTPAN